MQKVFTSKVFQQCSSKSSEKKIQKKSNFQNNNFRDKTKLQLLRQTFFCNFVQIFNDFLWTNSHECDNQQKKLSFNLTLSIANFVMTMREYYNTTYISVLIFRIGLLLLVTTTITTTPIKTPPVE